MLYSAPPDKAAIISSFWACNQGEELETFSMAVVPAGDTRGTHHNRYTLEPVRANRTFVATCGITLDEGSAIYVYTPGTFSFAIDGTELDQESP